MQRKLENKWRSEDEEIKESGLVLDWDEIARKGKISDEEKLVAKWYGIYASRQEGNYMARVVIPGGVMRSTQVRGLAAVAEDYAQGLISFTTRQSAQLHWLKLPMISLMMRDLRKAELSTFHGCGDVTRNTTACPWASVCPHRRLDVLPHARRTARLLRESRDLDNLPRKFKISFSGCGAACAQPMINDVGLTAIVREGTQGAGEIGFKVHIGGGMGWKPFVAQELYSFVPEELIAPLCRAVGILFRDHGDRYNRATARLKFLVARYGIEKCRKLVDDILDGEGVSRDRFETEPVTDCGPPWPKRPLIDPAPVASDGTGIQAIMLPKGEISFAALARVAELSEIFGDKKIYSTNRQNLEIHGVRRDKIPELKEEIAKLGFATEGFFGLKDVVPCVGLAYCPKAVSRTHDLYDLTQAVVHQDKYAEISDKVIVNITGCPNSCSPYHIADIGFRGLRIRELLGSVEAYEMRIGGTQEKFGVLLGEYKVPDAVRVTVRVLDTFLELRSPDETLAENLRRVGIDPYREAAAALGIRYEMAPNPLENSVFTGCVEEVRDRNTIAKDVPCQAACPAKTDVPAYIQMIAQGRHEAAYRINQEDNVFPGVLGRICSRPCEDACRFHWTNTTGPVRICHLKRSAADRKEAPRPLEPWFDKTRRRVAVVGGGPAGLAAARDLMRYGHEVTIFEREKFLGGMMRLGVPTFRLPRSIVEEEVGAIVDAGADIRLGEAIDRNKIEGLIDEYDAVLVATGACQAQAAEIEGLPPGVALSGLEFMRRYNLGEGALPAGDVIVVGGGFTAVDCARAARRLLGDRSRVGIVYRRSEEYMSASREELEQIRLENIRVETLLSPVSARVEEGRVKGVTFRRNLLGEAEEGKKPRMIEIANSDCELPCDTLIFAIGQSPDRDILPGGDRIVGRRNTGRAGLFVTGDFAYGSLDVIHAVADGKAAAEDIELFLMGEKRRRTWVRLELVEDQILGTGRLRDMDLAPPPVMPVITGESRTGDREVGLGFDNEATQVHAERCYLCNHKYEIDQDRCIHCDWCIQVMPRDCITHASRIFADEDGAPRHYVETTKPKDATFIFIDSNECIRCGKCLRICPTQAITVRKTCLIRESES